MGYSEALHPGSEFDETASLGEVLRTTVILHLFKNDQVTWLIDWNQSPIKNPRPLLENNPLIHRILPFNPISILQLQSEFFDVVINLERVPGICALAESINAESKYGFRFDKILGDVRPDFHYTLEPYMSIDTKREMKKPWQEILFNLLGKSWNKEEYSLGYQPGRLKTIYDIGFNYQVGTSWPLKAWSIKNFHQLENKLIQKDFHISWQQGMDNLQDYIDWIHSCKMIITNDSLGLHLAIALKKQIIALFGPSSPDEVYLYELGTKILPAGNFSCMPCWNQKCEKKKSCMEEITVDQVYKEVIRLLPDAQRDYQRNNNP